ncbi:hypothetical protein [Streptomyces sp. YS415]|uniref:hypothetical protein n=1 Tax=Streptomyces sp. YS415 TaxID=2944806 RepID=UPI0020216599|nr:hypothetical protein [Streptomyces sp. YS415]MCL7430371.1 hypothetical protein [Streptomyces sp. YS415]
MTSSPNSPDQAWVLQVTIWAAPAADPQWKAQLNRLRTIASFDDTTKTWWVNRSGFGRDSIV